MLYGEINKVYEKADQILKLKIRSQLKGTEIEFKNFWDVNDFVTDKKFYLISFEDGGIRFQNVNEFYTKFLGLVKFRIQENKKEIETIEHHIAHDRYPDPLYSERDSLYGVEYCLDKLKIRLEKLIVKPPEQESPKA